MWGHAISGNLALWWFFCFCFTKLKCVFRLSCHCLLGSFCKYLAKLHFDVLWQCAKLSLEVARLASPALCNPRETRETLPWFLLSVTTCFVSLRQNLSFISQYFTVHRDILICSEHIADKSADTCRGKSKKIKINTNLWLKVENVCGLKYTASWGITKCHVPRESCLSSKFLWVIQIFFPSPPSFLFQSRHGTWSGPTTWWRQLPGPARGEEQTHNQFNGGLKITNLLSSSVLKPFYFCNFYVDV